MNIIINLKAYFDWESMDDMHIPSEEEMLALKYKPGSDGKILKKVRKEVITHNLTSLPESEIQSVMEHFERVGAPKSRNRVIAWYLEEKIFPHHFQLSDIESFETDDESVTQFLNNNLVGN